MFNDGPRLDLLARAPVLKRILKARAFQPVLMLLTLFVFTLAILTGIAGTPAGSRNFGIMFVWIVWWALLIVVLVPFFGRLWCTVCPIPAPGEWLQRRAIVRRRPGKLWTRGLRWPRRLLRYQLRKRTIGVRGPFTSGKLKSAPTAAFQDWSMMLRVLAKKSCASRSSLFFARHSPRAVASRAATVIPCP